MKTALFWVAVGALGCTLARAETLSPTPMAVTQAASRMAVNIEAQPIRAALLAFGQQTGLQVLFRSEDVSAKGLTTPRVSGDLSAQEALDRLLATTGLKYEFVNEHTVRISSVKSLSAAPTVDPQTQWVDATVPFAEPTQASQSPDQKSLDEIVVTGTHIHGAVPDSSPLLVFDRAAIEQSGASSVQQFLETLPQNFSGGVSEATGIAQGEVGGAGGIVNGAGVNLRGLGNSATLVLLNGRRVSPAGVGDYVDVSMIPVSAIERIDVMTDGASAIYGSDAVSGVVNIVLRTDYDGAETHARYGAVTSGGLHEFQADQTFGTTWSTGHALLSYNYSNRTALSAAARSYTDTAEQPTDLLPAQRRNAGLLTLSQDLGQYTEGFLTALLSKRTFRYYSTSEGATSFTDGSSKLYDGTIGVRVRLPQDWRAELSATLSRSTGESPSYNSGSGGTYTADFNTQTKSGVVDVSFDGPVLSIPGGKILAAVGGQFRHESLNADTSFDASDTLVAARSRRVHAAFGELNIPLVGDPNARPGIRRLDLTLAARSEHYSDFGNSFDPKFGVMYSPIAGLRLRATYGRSFQAPLLDQLDPAQRSIDAFPLSDSGGALIPTILIFGNNGVLKPEKSKTWTAGLELRPEFDKNLSLDLTYFDVTFDNQIASPAPGLQFFSFLSNPALVPFVTRAPSPESIASYFAAPSFQNPFGYAPSDIGAIADNSLQNLAKSQIRGLDLQASGKWDTKVGTLGAGIAGTYYLTYRRQTLSSAPLLSILNTVFNPVDLRLRGNATWSKAGWSIAAFVNYTNSYKNNIALPAQAVSSWTTFDAQLAYSTGYASAHWLRDIRVTFSAINLTNRNPPTVVTNSVGLNYDGANADVLGRSIALDITKGWGASER